MSDPRWTEIRRLFERALELDPAQRSAWLCEECRGDDELQREVECLLETDADESDASDARAVLDRGASGTLLARISPDRMLGVDVGGFRVRRVIGSGGMGTVFEAEQDRPRRTVALKMLRLGLGTERSRRRFEYEAEILGRLRHPGIAQIYGAGTLDDADSGDSGDSGGAGAPYFAMELIEGAKPLDAFVRDSHLDLPDVLQIVCKVCDAVHYGHQRGVIHRDLKPANILVDDAGQPKIIDFGIARATDADVAQATLLTETGQILGTLQYMSPEQLDADAAAVDTRADVYALGVILYELLVGRPPFELRGLPLTVAAETLRDRTPERPSVASRVRREGAAAAPSAGDIPAELDWIVLKAMDRDIERRYASASELRADLERFLRGEPVAAGPPSAGYRLRKFIRRNRLAVGAAAFCLLALVIGTVSTSIGWRRAVNAEQLAERRREQAEEVAETLWQVNNLLGAVQRRAGEELDEALERRVDALVARLDGATIDNASVEASMRSQLAGSYRDLDQQDKARSQYQRALTLLNSEASPIPDVRVAVLNGFGGFLFRRGELEQAEELLRESLRARVDLYGEVEWGTAQTVLNLAGLLYERGKYEDAVRAYERAHDVFLALGGADDLMTISAQRGRANALQELGRFEEAEIVLREALRAATEYHGAANPETLRIENSLAVVLQAQKRFAEAEAILRGLAETHAREMGEAHVATLYVLNNLGMNHMMQEKYAEAEAVFRQVLDVRQRAGRGGGLDDLIPRNNLVMALHEQGTPDKLEECEELVRDLIADAEKMLPADNWRIAVFRMHYGACLGKQSRFAAAEAVLLEAVGALEKSLGAGNRRTLTARRDLLQVYEGWGKPAEAEAVRRRLAVSPAEADAGVDGGVVAPGEGDTGRSSR